MPDIPSLIQSGTADVWLLLPVALVLGALHALEPGHSKSMMTAFIVAIHGTAAQAVLLALSVTVGHTIVVWVLAVLAWQLQDTAILDKAEPWLLLIGGLLIVTLALRILSRLELPFGSSAHAHDHDHGHGHAHSHRPGHHHHSHSHDDLDEDEDAHAAAHAAELKRRLAKGPVTDADIAWFGFSGGLIPCPAAFAVLLACFHQRAYALGVVMVAAFSIGLALMLVAIGLVAAWGAKALASRAPGLDRLARWAPYASAAIVLVIGLVVTAQGVAALKLV
jgi:nickel/cobalt transporter (NicO) family protein